MRPTDERVALLPVQPRLVRPVRSEIVRCARRCAAFLASDSDFHSGAFLDFGFGSRR